MAKKIVQLENKDGDQIFPISATDIALPGTKVKTEFRTSGGDIAAQTDTVLVTETIATPGDYAVIGSMDVQMITSGRVDVHLYHNGSTQLAQQYTTPISNRAGLTLIGRLDNASEGDTVSLNVRCDYSATADNRTQGLVLIKLPEGAPTYKGGALVVTLNTDNTYSGADNDEIYDAIATGKPVVFKEYSTTRLFVPMSVRRGFQQKLVDIMYDEATRMLVLNDAGTWALMDSYSIQEQRTGETWLDGKPIYKKTIYRAATGAASSITINTGITNGDMLVDLKVVCKASGGKYIFPIIEPGQWETSVRSISSDLTTILINTNQSSTLATADIYATIYYTKTTD